MSKRVGRPTLEEVACGERRSQILNTARALFGQRGYAAVSIGQIAEEVGITKAAMYHHFPSKDELYTAVVCDLLEHILAGIRAIVAGEGSVREKLRRLAEQAILQVPVDADMDAFMRDAREHLSPEQRAQIARAHVGMMAAVTELMQQGIAKGELQDWGARLMAYIFMELMIRLNGRNGHAAGFPATPALVDAVLGLFLEGAAVRTNSR